MKRIIMLAMALVVMLGSIGGCFLQWDRDGGHGRGQRHEERH